MASYIHQIETAVPSHRYEQQELREVMKDLVAVSERDRRLIHHMYARSGIRSRYSVVDDFKPGGSRQLYFNGEGARPGTLSRNDRYIREGRRLFVRVAEQLIEKGDIPPGEITHLITVSCTGFYAPGPDYDIIRGLGLNPATERYHLGFMGCYAAIPAMKLADRICRADPDATVMVISIELCTLHFQPDHQMDQMLSASVFADGGAGMIIRSRTGGNPLYRIDGFASSITENGADDMAWSIGDYGFNMVLSSYIPELLGQELEPFLRPVLNEYGISREEIRHWAVHPGGRAILDRVESSAGLPADSLRASRRVLSDYGNMSSATILFVLRELMNDPSRGTVLAMAFGPGLTIESTLLTSLPSD
jgi:predicted naringenin-chalcone synthase